MNHSSLDTIISLLDENSKLSPQNRESFGTSIAKVTLEYKKLTDILSIVIGGSVARGLADNESDIEMYVYCHTQIPPERKVKKIMDNLRSRMTRSSDLVWQHEVWGPHTFFAINNVYFELGYRIFPEVESKVREYLAGKDIYSHHTKEADTPFGYYTSGIAFCIASSKILYEDESKKLSSFKKRVEEFPQELKRKLINHYFNEADKMLHVKLRSSSHRNDDLAFNAQLASIVRSLNVCLFTLNDTHFPGDKWNFDIIKQFRFKPSNYETILGTILNKSNEGAQNKCQKYVLLERLLDKINQISLQNIK